jgi:GT2 family glycosyltransferase
MLSVVIPSYKDPLLVKTIDSLLVNSEGEIEIIAVLDGYWPGFQLIQDPRVRYIHLGRNRGMREAINAGVRVSRGEFLMRADEHQMFGQGYDVILTRDCQPNWIMTPRRYALNPVKWEIMKEIPPVDFAKLKIVKMGMAKDFEDHPGENPYIRKFSGVEAPGDDSKPIQETYAMQGSCWVMPRKWWGDVIGELETEGYGPLYQDSHEMVFKTWKAGGKLMVNKNTWHAHKHRSFPRTHNNGTPENPSNNEQCWAYSLSIWEDYYNEISKTWN